MLRVAITGGAGAIAYQFVPLMLARLFPGQRIDLRLLDIEAQKDRLEAAAMEIEDLASNRLAAFTWTTDEERAFDQADWVLMLGAYPRMPGMERSDLPSRNGSIFRQQGAAIARCAASTVQVVVVGNPCNTNAMIAAHAAAPTLPPTAFTAMMMLDHSRALAVLADFIGCLPEDMDGMSVWGNHSATMVPLAEHLTVRTVPCQLDAQWLHGYWLQYVRDRGAAVIQKRGLSSAASAAWALCDHIELLLAKESRLFSLAVYSEGAYGSTPGTWVSLPHRKRDAKLCLEDYTVSAHARTLIDASMCELADERAVCIALGLIA